MVTDESGPVILTQDITCGQPYYDSIVNQTGCANPSDTLACLRTPFFVMSLRLAFGPWMDGVLLTGNAQDLLANGEYTKYKRLAAFHGDVFFHAPRRNMLGVTDGAVPTIEYLRGRATPILDASHGTDVAGQCLFLFPLPSLAACSTSQAISKEHTISSIL
ncbi:hypothetical protein B0H19DRAFT_1143489 [Mycena capillaripes]|nr:hypothetical protein B0H19DRAFT_1143489 [Mycena capillaripes]